MIKNIYIENYKCFSKATNIELSNITACIGTNSVGKSSLIQSLLLLKSTHEVFELQNYPINTFCDISLNDKYGMQLGDVSQVISANGSNEITLKCDEVLFSYEESDNKLFLKTQTKIDNREILVNSKLSNKFYYLNAERIGPRNYQKIASDIINDCGFHGEYTFDFINKNEKTKIDTNRKYPSTSKLSTNLSKQIEYWLQFIIDGVEVNFTSNIDMRLSQMKIKQQVFDTPFSSPYNFGFGISYIIPIIVTCLAAKPNSVIIIENPEAHLHPSGQSRIGQFLTCMADSGLQIIIETHSEHVINGMRVYSLKHNLQPSKIALNYFSINKDTEQHSVKRIQLNENMDILEWPEGFFDQEESDLKELRQLRGRKHETTRGL